MTNSTLTIFREWNDTGEIIALFPAEPWDHAGNCTSYMHIGQHGAANYRAILDVTSPAPALKTANLKAELRSLGYTLRVRQRYYR